MRRCIANTLEGKQCKRTATKGEDFCGNHTPRPFKPRAWFIEINLKPYERLPNGRFRKRIIGKPFAKREHAENWLSNNWSKLAVWPERPHRFPKGARFGPDTSKRFVSACIQSYPVERQPG